MSYHIFTNRLVMFLIQGITLGIAFTLACAQESDTSKAIPADQLLSIDATTSDCLTLKQVTAKSKTTGKHEFSVILEGTPYLCLSYAFEKPYMKLYYVFKKECFLKVVEPPLFETELVPYKDTAAAVRKPWTPDSRVTLILNSKGLTPQEATQSLRSRLGEPSAKSFAVLPAFILSGYFSAKNLKAIEAQYQLNSQNARQFDAMKIELNMNPKEVGAQFGAQSVRTLLIDGNQIRIYGVNPPPQINSSYKASWVAVVYKNEKVIKVYSNDFFNPDYLNKQLPATMPDHDGASETQPAASSPSSSG